MTRIEAYAFASCGLKEVCISDIAAWCNIYFNGVHANPLFEAGHLYLKGEEVKDLVIPTSVTSIGAYAFYGCSGLTSITIPTSVTYIGREAFRYCSGLNKVTIPNSVTSIGYETFYGCSALKEVHISDLASWCNIKFDGCNANPLCYAGHLYVDGEEVKDLVVPNGVASIGSCAFYSCSGLTSVAIPNSVENILNDAFNGCTSLEKVKIGSGITSIGDCTFANCPFLLDVYCYAESVPATMSTAFYESDVVYATLHVQDASMDAYKAKLPWSEFGTIVGVSGEEIEVPEVVKCATPTVAYADGKLSMSSATEGAEFVTKVANDDVATYYDAEIELSASYNIEVFALKSGCENSDTVSVTLCRIDKSGVDEETGVISVPATPVLMQSHDGMLFIDGINEGAEIVVYTVNGTEVASCTASGATVAVATGVQKGDIVIVKIGNRSVKVRM